MTDERWMTDHETPLFSTLVVDWFRGMETPRQLDMLTLMGVRDDQRESYIRALHHQPVVLSSTTPPALTGSLPVVHVEITPTMAIEGGPSVKDRPMPRPGSRNPKPTIDLTKRS
jgi:hypothetical protein